MKRQFLMLSGVTRRDRNAVITDVNAAVSLSGGWVVNHTLFSNAAFALQVELPESGIAGFCRLVAEAEVTLSKESRANIPPAAKSQDHHTEEVKVSLNITFLHGEPDLRRDVAAVPG